MRWFCLIMINKVLPTSKLATYYTRQLIIIINKCFGEFPMQKSKKNWDWSCNEQFVSANTILSFCVNVHVISTYLSYVKIFVLRQESILTSKFCTLVGKLICFLSFLLTKYKDVNVQHIVPVTKLVVHVYLEQMQGVLFDLYSSISSFTVGAVKKFPQSVLYCGYCGCCSWHLLSFLWVCSVIRFVLHSVTLPSRYTRVTCEPSSSVEKFGVTLKLTG